MQIRQLFGFCGAVIGLNRVGDQQQYMLIEYTYPTVWPNPLSAALLGGLSCSADKLICKDLMVAIAGSPQHI